MTISGIPNLLREWVALQREQNSLLRELIWALTHQPPKTQRLLPASEDGPGKIRLRTDRDVSFVGRTDWKEAQEKEKEAVDAPWRTPPPNSPS